ncbi:MAG: ribosomal-protein-alanine N-acetyltransferase, partial [Phototrophicales bacterium]
MDTKLTPILREMAIEDLEQVSLVEQEAFNTSWTTTTYIYNVNRYSTTHLGVIELPELPPYRHPRPERLQVLPPYDESLSIGAIVAYGSMWIRNGEGHISQLAVHPSHRGQRLGELMLVGLLAKAMACHARFSALEVRVSNVVAQALYMKYGYRRAEVLPKYYSDNHEDAYLMKTSTLNEKYWLAFRENVLKLAHSIT